jgi:hypothetical protein
MKIYMNHQILDDNSKKQVQQDLLIDLTKIQKKKICRFFFFDRNLTD